MALQLALSDMMSMATTFAGGRGDWSLSEASRLVNLAYDEIASRYNVYQGLEKTAASSTTSGGNVVSLPSDFVFSISNTLYIPSNSTQSSTGTQVVPLRMRDSRWLDAQQISGDDSGTNTVGGIPEAYIVFGNVMQLWPSPNSSYSMQLRYSAKNPTLVAMSDVPVIDSRWHVGIVYKAWSLMEASRDNPQAAAIAQNTYLNYMTSTPNDYALRQRERTGMTLRLKRGGDNID